MDGAEVKAAIEGGPGAGRRRWRGVLAASALVLVGAGVLAGGIYWRWLNTAPPMPQTMAEAMAVVQSARFKRLPTERQAPYVDRARELFLSLDAQQRQELAAKVRDDPALHNTVAQAREAFVLDMAKQYVAADPDGRRALVDKAIAMMEMQRKLGPKPEPKDRAQMKQFMQDRVERGNPQQQQQLSEFYKDLRTRRTQLGLDPDPPFHR